MPSLALRTPRRIVPMLIALTTTFAGAGAAASPGVFDNLYDFAPTYVGARHGDLDINFASATLKRGEMLSLWSNQVGWLGDQGIPTFVWGIDRGAGAERLVSGSPGLGAGVAFDAVVVLTGNGFSQEATGFVTTFGLGGPVTTDISAGAFAYDSVIGAVLPLALLPSTGFAAADYRVNLWTRDAPGNAHIADFAVDGGMMAVGDLRGVVPEPAAWALMIAGFGMAGATLRKRRRIPTPA